jgi:hypothetical protein
MPSNESLEDARVVALELAHEPDWRGFATYCDLRVRGLRKAALDTLRRFVVQAQAWPYEERRRFTAWLAERATRLTYAVDGRIHTAGILLPQPVVDGVVRPTLREWREREPGSALPYLWSALLHHSAPGDEGENQEQLLRQALAADPKCERARVLLVGILTGYVEFQQHHLPETYLGDPAAGLRTLEEARELLRDAGSDAGCQAMERRLTLLEQLTRDWVQFREQGGGNFAEWCASRGKTYRWNRAYHYGPRVPASDGP